MGAAETAGTLERKWASKTERRGGGKDFFRDGSVRGGVAEAPGPAARPGILFRHPRGSNMADAD